MKQYIDKAAIVAEIERRINEVSQLEKLSYEMGLYDAYKIILSFLDTLEVKEVKEEPISNDLEEAARNYPSAIRVASPQWESELENAFKAGAKWQKEQMEKNRIAHCDNITEEQYNLETGFLDGFLDKNKRMPTFLDAIEYGMKKKITEACKWLEENKEHPLIGCEDVCLSGYLTNEFIEEFKKAMEE